MGAAAPTALLDPAWLETITSQPGVRARLTGRPDVPLALASIVREDYLSDVEKVSGGTGFKIMDVGDPVNTRFRRRGE